MQERLSAEEAMLCRLVGVATFRRGREYARQGAVRRREWNEEGTLLTGEVRGAARQAYLTEVAVSRTGGRQLSAVRSSCTCPVGQRCKHAVALLLAESPPTKAEESPPTKAEKKAPPKPKERRPPTWRSALGGLLAAVGDAPGPVVPDQEPAVGLRFELVASPAKRSHTSGHRISLRPVLPGAAGNWVKTGISWANLDYAFYGRPCHDRLGQQIVLLKELLGFSRTVATAYQRVDDVVWLETINSRRVWDLLVEARNAGIPLLAGGRRPRPLALHAQQATVGVDVTRAPLGPAGPSGHHGLRVEPQIRLGDQAIPLGTSLLVGHPAHGVVWWDGQAGPLGLSAAPLAEAVTDELRPLLRAAAVEIPARDERHFLGDVLPPLCRRLSVRSSDESVDLPEAVASTLLLTIGYHGDHRVGLGWSWLRQLGADERREALWQRVGTADDRAEQDGVVDAVVRAVASVPELVDTTPFGICLAPTAELVGMDSVRFLTEVLPIIEDLAAVAVEHDGDMPDYREAETAPAVVLGGTASEDQDWFDLTVTVTVDGEEVPFGELFVALAEERTHLILPSGTYFSLDRDELRQLAALIAEARGLVDAEGGIARLSRFQASLWEELRRLGIIAGQAAEWEDSVRRLTDATERIEHPVPVSLDATLRPYQQEGFNWLTFLHDHDLGGILADDMGLGKTVQALALMCHTKEQGASNAPFLVVAPTSVVENWASECRKFAPGLDAAAITETVARRGVKMAKIAEEVDLVITSYALFRLEYGDYAAIEWAGMFLDEAQFAKNRNSKAYQRAKMLPVHCKIAMTGTPMENNLMELWSLLSITAPGLFASPDHFAECYRVPIERQGDTEKLDQLRRRMRPLLLRRTKEKVASDLPEKQEQILELDLDPKHRKVYQTHLQRERQKVLGLLGDMTKHRFEIFRSLTLLRQLSLDASLIDAKYAKVPSTKLDALMRMVGDIVTDGHRVLVFSQFTRFLASASARLTETGVEHCYLDGKTRNRPEVISRFRSGQAPAFLISLKAGGFGLNLTEADYCILLDPWWNPASEAQAVDRVHRIGQTRKVMVYRLVAKDTIEEKVMALKARKAALFANVIDAGGFESGALTAEDIRSLLS